MAGGGGGSSVGRMTDDRDVSAATAPAPAAPVPARAASSSTGSVLGRVVAGLLVLAFAGVTAAFAPMLVMASDGCFEGDTRTICSVVGQQIVGFLPLVAAVAAAILAVVGMSSNSEEGAVRGWICLLVGPGVLMLAWVVGLALAGG